MPTATPPSTLNARLIESYTDQASELPEDIRAEISDLWDGAPIHLYALSDLNAAMQLEDQWLVLGAEELVLVAGDASLRQWTRVQRSRIAKAEVIGGLSAERLRIVSNDPEPRVLAELHYSRRQQRCMKNIEILLNHEGESAPGWQADDLYQDSVAEPVRNAQAAVRGSEAAVIWRLMGYLKPYRLSVGVGVGAAVCATIMALIPPRLAGWVIDALKEGAAYTGPSLWWSVGGMAMAFLAMEFFMFIRYRQLAFMGEHVAHDLRQQLYAHVQTLSLAFFTKKQTGSIIARCSSDTDRLWDFIAFGIIEVAVSLLMLLGLGGVLIWMDWRLGLVMVLPVPVLLYAFVLHGRMMQKVFLKAWRKWSDMTSVLSGTIPGMRVVKAFHQEAREVRRFKRQNDQCLDTFSEVHRVWIKFWPGLMLSFHTIVVIVWAYALPRLTGVVQPELSAGTFVTFLLYMGMFMHPLQVIGQMTRMLNRAVSSAHRIFEVLDTEPQITNIENPVTLDPVREEISFENVGFTYDGIRPVLHDISFRVRAGEMIGLVGPSGAGKSTLINLLARFHDCTDGQITVDGEDLRRIEIGSYRRSLGMVLQEPYLFHGTLLDNISYGLENPKLDEVIEAARAAHAHEFICKLDQGYETVVGERGQTLSGGERQRVSIARAILHNPRILILDEATSNVDTETERKIQNALDALVQGRTVIAIAHRLSTLQRANRLLVLKDGKLVEQGTHEELLALEGGVFRGLYDMQQELHRQYVV